LIALIVEWWQLRATSTSASGRSSASMRSTMKFEPVDPCTENIVRSAPCAPAAKRSASPNTPVWSTRVPKNPAEMDTSEA
jgi:hypothetical protein